MTQQIVYFYDPVVRVYTWLSACILHAKPSWQKHFLFINLGIKVINKNGFVFAHWPNFVVCQQHKHAHLGRYVTLLLHDVGALCAYIACRLVCPHKSYCLCAKE